MIRVLYAGSPDASAETLRILLEKSSSCGFEIAGVLTNPPSAQGRHKTPVPTPVAVLARENALPVLEPEHLDGACREETAALNPDILVCFAYGHIFGPKFMSLFRFGGINLHPSALPQYRGCTPVPAAILNGDDTTAFTVQKVSEKMDEGNILAQVSVPLTKTETGGSLLNDAAVRGAELLCGVLADISKTGTVPEGRVQEGKATYTGIITKQDAKIDWSKSAEAVDALVRAYFPSPAAWTTENGLSLKILSAVQVREDDSLVTEEMRAAAPGTVCAFIKQAGIFVRCGTGFLAVKNLQRQGKNAVDYKSFMNGARDFIGTHLE